jgi:hypothetical protein
LRTTRAHPAILKMPARTELEMENSGLSFDELQWFAHIVH